MGSVDLRNSSSVGVSKEYVNTIPVYVNIIPVYCCIP